MSFSRLGRSTAAGVKVRHRVIDNGASGIPPSRMKHVIVMIIPHLVIWFSRHPVGEFCSAIFSRHIFFVVLHFYPKSDFTRFLFYPIYVVTAGLSVILKEADKSDESGRVA